MGNLSYGLYSRVIKIDVMWPFCVKHHINVHLDMLVVFIKNNAQKKLITHQLPLLCVVAKNKFGHHRIGD
jgi:hypothetical protein